MHFLLERDKTLISAPALLECDITGMTRTRFRFDTVVGRVIYFVYRFVENNNTSNSSSSSLTQPLECAWYIFYEWIRIERKGTTSWLG